MRVLIGLALLLCSGLAQANGYLAIIIDDLGHNYSLGRAVLDLPKAVTASVLPRLAWSRRIASEAHRQGREIMLHQPMSSIRHLPLGPGGMTLEHTTADIQSLLEANLASVPYASGVNNHMGSLLTGQEDSMNRFMAVLRQRGDLYFVDSRTGVMSKASMKARAEGLVSSRRDVFLDNERDPVEIKKRLLEAVRVARLKGTAIAIGHPYPETIAVLAAELPALLERGIQLVPVSQLIALQRSPKIWHASSSPLPKVAKSSKPLPSSTCCEEPVSK